MDASSRPLGEVPQHPGPARRLRLRSLRCKRRILQDLLRGTQSAAQPLAAADGALAPPLSVHVIPTINCRLTVTCRPSPNLECSEKWSHRNVPELSVHSFAGWDSSRLDDRPQPRIDMHSGVGHSQIPLAGAILNQRCATTSTSEEDLNPTKVSAIPSIWGSVSSTQNTSAATPPLPDRHSVSHHRLRKPATSSWRSSGTR